MKALLIYPQYPVDTFWSFKHIMKFIRKKAAYPPLGLLTVASIFPKQWEKKLVDLNVTQLKDKDIEWADMVFVSAMLVQAESASEAIKRCKAAGKIVVAGGPAFTTQPERFPEVDCFVQNEGEITIPMFLADLENGTLKKFYTTTERPDITNTPIPDWSLIRMKDYVTMSVQYSRGCPFNCEFCDIVIMNGRVPRTKTPEQMVAEFQSLYDAGWRDSVFIVDDNFIGNKITVKKMLPELIRWQKKNNYPFKLLTEASIDLADDIDLMRMMSRANFHKVFLGLETPSLDGLKECGKFQNTTRDLVASVKKIHNNGMQVMGGFIVGFDTDTEGVFEAQFRFIQKIGVVTAMVGVLTALPQTRLWYRLKEEGRLLGDSGGSNTADGVNFIPKMGKEKLMEGYEKLLKHVYSPKNYYKRIYTFVKEYRPTVKSRLTRRDIYAFIMSIWRIGIFSKACPHYWKLLVKTIVRNKKALPIAVELAIQGQHYRKIVKRTFPA
ncbi:DUF4070 domain-containing protein [Candidatus Woesearchaeota archaeon]|nr:DUF4070 domain-containing protein [Candidatus Woesearchaeota archaeon]